MTATTFAPPASRSALAAVEAEWLVYWRAGIKRWGLYRFRDRWGQLLYLGESSAPHLRHDQHADKPWWPYYLDLDGGSWEVGPGRYRSRVAARVAERAAIRAERPLYNVEHNQGNPYRVVVPRRVRRPVVWSARPARRSSWWQAARWSRRRIRLVTVALAWHALTGGLWAVIGGRLPAAHGAELAAVVATGVLITAARSKRHRRRRRR